MTVKLSAYQAVSLYGWLASDLKLCLRWQDVLKHNNITFDACCNLAISVHDLHEIQPDVIEWQRHAGLTLFHLPIIAGVFDAHPVHHMRADLGDIAAMYWSSDTMLSLGLKYNDLVAVGLTPQNMQLFGYTLLGWMKLGLTEQDLEEVDEVTIRQLFGMTKIAALRCYRESS